MASEGQPTFVYFLSDENGMDALWRITGASSRWYRTGASREMTEQATVAGWSRARARPSVMAAAILAAADSGLMASREDERLCCSACLIPSGIIGEFIMMPVLVAPG